MSWILIVVMLTQIGCSTAAVSGTFATREDCLAALAQSNGDRTVDAYCAERQ